MSAVSGEAGDRPETSLATPLARVRGLGAAGEGAHHWWLERLTSLSTLLLIAWLGVSLLRLPDLGYRTVNVWLSDPFVAVPMLLLIVSTFWHLKLGLQVVVDDYVHDEGNRYFSLVLINFLSILAGALALFAVLRIAFAGSPA